MLVLTVAGSSASLNVAVTTVPTATPVAPLAGVRELTVGGVVSGAEATVRMIPAAAASTLPLSSVALDLNVT